MPAKLLPAGVPYHISTQNELDHAAPHVLPTIAKTEKEEPRSAKIRMIIASPRDEQARSTIGNRADVRGCGKKGEALQRLASCGSHSYGCQTRGRTGPIGCNSEGNVVFLVR